MLIERFKIGIGELLAMISSLGFDFVKVNPNPFVGVSDVNAEGKIIIEGVCRGGEIELCERGVSDVEVDLIGPENEPKG